MSGILILYYYNHKTKIIHIHTINNKSYAHKLQVKNKLICICIY